MGAPLAAQVLLQPSEPGVVVSGPASAVDPRSEVRPLIRCAPRKDMSTLEKAAELLDDDGRQLRARALYSAALPSFKAHQARIGEMKGSAVCESEVHWVHLRQL